MTVLTVFASHGVQGTLTLKTPSEHMWHPQPVLLHPRDLPESHTTVCFSLFCFLHSLAESL